MPLKLELIAAVCENMGIGFQGKLPWRLKSEMAYFTKMTTTTSEINKKNIVIMGRKTWESIPKKFKPLTDRINIVLSSTLSNVEDALVYQNLPAALDAISQPPLKDKVERIWVIGGSSIYKAAFESPNFHRLYLTRIKKDYECDIFFPELPKSCNLIRDPDVPEGILEENGIEFSYEVYQKSDH